MERYHVIKLLVLCILTAGCLAEEVSLPDTLLGCTSDSDCPSGLRCSVDDACKPPPGGCGDGVVDVDFGELCDDGNTEVGDLCPSGPTGSCEPSRCGDGFINETVSILCSETCGRSENGVCDDGGPGSRYSDCGLGTDCKDCGERLTPISVETCDPELSVATTCDALGLAGTREVVCNESSCHWDLSPCRETEGELISLPSGSFTMGSPQGELGREDAEGPRHVVQLTHPFELSDHEVTQGEWESLMGANPAFLHRGSCESCPVEGIGWWDALHYLNALSARDGYAACFRLEGCLEDVVAGYGRDCTSVSFLDAEGHTVDSPYACEGYRLPTEAEWEYAYRAGTSTAFYNAPITSEDSFDAGLDAIAWYYDNTAGASGARSSKEVRTKAPNSFGLFDMAGNVYEWVMDSYANYPGQDRVDPYIADDGGGLRIYRGGSWYSWARYCRAGARPYFSPSGRYSVLGFRVARSL